MCPLAITVSVNQNLNLSMLRMWWAFSRSRFQLDPTILTHQVAKITGTYSLLRHKMHTKELYYKTSKFHNIRFGLTQKAWGLWDFKYIYVCIHVWHLNSKTMLKIEVQIYKMRKILQPILDIFNLLNNYLSSVCTLNDGLTPDVVPLVSQSDGIDSISFSPVFVAIAIRKVKPSHSCGPDGLPSVLYNKLSKSLAHPLLLIFESFMTTFVTPLGRTTRK